MELNVFNKNLELIGIVDFYNSIIWTPRYNDVGDFELYLEATPDTINLLQKDNYIGRNDDDMLCIIEKVQTVTDVENGQHLLVSGRDLKSLLSRRIVWEQTTVRGTVEAAIHQLINENIINPTIHERRINNFTLAETKGFSETIEMQITGKNLLETIVEICGSYEYGFKVTLNDEKQFVFSLYKGVDRSYQQSENPYVVFSPNFDNVKTVEYMTDKTEYKNTALVAGEGEGLDRKTVTVGGGSDIDRYEIYVDARDVSTNEGEITIEDYNKLLSERGMENLTTLIMKESFSGDIEPSMNYEYKKDYFLGDIVQIENELGITMSSRITEIIECMDESGYSMVPTFATREGE